MDYSYYFGYFPSLGLNLAQYLFLCVFIIIITFGFVNYVSFKINSTYKRIIYLLLYIMIWFLIGGLLSGLSMSILGGVIYVMIREFSGDYS